MYLGCHVDLSWWVLPPNWPKIMWSHSFYKKTFFLHLVYNISQTHLDEQRHSVQGNELSYCGSPIAGKVFYTTLKMYLATFFFSIMRSCTVSQQTPFFIAVWTFQISALNIYWILIYIFNTSICHGIKTARANKKVHSNCWSHLCFKIFTNSSSNWRLVVDWQVWYWAIWLDLADKVFDFVSEH